MNICLKCAGRAPDGVDFCATCAPPPAPPPVEPLADAAAPRPEGVRLKFVAMDPTDVRGENDGEAPKGIVQALLDHPLATLVIVGMLIAVFAVNRRIAPAPERGDVHCATRDEARMRDLLVRPAAIIPDTVELEQASIPFREAWVAQIGGWHNISWIGTEWAMFGTSRYRLYFSVNRAVWPEGAQVEAMDGRRVITEPRDAGGVPILLHQVDVPVMNPPLIEFRLTRAGRPNVAARFAVH